ncbi:MAG: hypothetical protein HN509_03575 [Halobacteriovoraceae bacterium]|jgi:hypothetical protein|nr:hypothetical protein [Halobacteriovoraceae bacterium]MBT5093726.1 hypothetical protein [Halobacteriovoraceae bacterium]
MKNILFKMLLVWLLISPLSYGMFVPQGSFDPGIPQTLQCFGTASINCFNNQASYKFGTGQIDQFTYQASLLHMANLSGTNIHNVTMPPMIPSAPGYFNGSRFSGLNSGMVESPQVQSVDFFSPFGNIAR